MFVDALFAFTFYMRQRLRFDDGGDVYTLINNNNKYYCAFSIFNIISSFSNSNFSRRHRLALAAPAGGASHWAPVRFIYVAQ
jgi:hypothetical protein